MITTIVWNRKHEHTHTFKAIIEEKNFQSKENFNPTAKDLGMAFTRFTYTSPSCRQKKLGQNKNNQKINLPYAEQNSKRKTVSRINIEL